mmetsp:Transcript_92328/g.240599  ORF Transcript_92328/g.240599 Transcript_92328/m.240599 type:complete len:223 (-) Transcript_92328:12-680(-)
MRKLELRRARGDQATLWGQSAVSAMRGRASAASAARCPPAGPSGSLVLEPSESCGPPGGGPSSAGRPPLGPPEVVDLLVIAVVLLPDLSALALHEATSASNHAVPGAHLQPALPLFGLQVAAALAPVERAWILLGALVALPQRVIGVLSPCLEVFLLVAIQDHRARRLLALSDIVCQRLLPAAHLKPTSTAGGITLWGTSNRSWACAAMRPAQACVRSARRS